MNGTSNTNTTADATPETRPMPSPTTTSTRGLLMVLQAADRLRLPVSDYIVVTPTGVDFQMRTAEEVGLWAHWIGGEVAVATHLEHDIYRTEATVFEQPVKVYAVDYHDTDHADSAEPAAEAVASR